MPAPLCPKHKTPMEFELVLTPGGGCCMNERCYCDSQDVHAAYFCPTVSNRGRRCAERIEYIQGLTDVRGIERWILERL